MPNRFRMGFRGRDAPSINQLSAVVGSMILRICATLLAGNPPASRVRLLWLRSARYRCSRFCCQSRSFRPIGSAARDCAVHDKTFPKPLATAPRTRNRLREANVQSQISAWACLLSNGVRPHFIHTPSATARILRANEPLPTLSSGFLYHGWNVAPG